MEAKVASLTVPLWPLMCLNNRERGASLVIVSPAGLDLTYLALLSSPNAVSAISYAQ